MLQLCYFSAEGTISGYEVAVMIPVCDALKVGYACDEARFFWFEDPYFDGGATEYGHRKLREYIRTPLLQGEKVHSIQQKVNLLLANATDFIHGGIPENGVTGTMKLAGAAEALGVDV